MINPIYREPLPSFADSSEGSFTEFRNDEFNFYVPVNLCRDDSSCVELSRD